MNRHLAMRSGNPALNKNTFAGLSGQSGDVMTIDGTVNKTFISLILLFVAALYGWNSLNTSLIMLGFVGGFILALVTIFKKHLSMYTVPFYAVFQGLALGSISYIFEHIIGAYLL